MNIKLHPVQYIFALYIIVSAYLIYSSFSLQQSLSIIQVVNLAPLSYALLILSSIILALSLFSLFRIPIFHYLFKMLHLWILMLCGILLLLFFKYGQILTNLTNPDLARNISAIFPGTHSEIFAPFISFIQKTVSQLKPDVVTTVIVITIILSIIQIFLYMPSSLRYVYYTHISPIKYSLKHIFISLLLFVPLLFIALYLFKLDASLNPNLEALLSLKQQQVKDKNNAFFPMLSQWKADIPDRVVYGETWLSNFRKMQVYFKQHKIPDNPTLYPDYSSLTLGGMNKADQSAINQLYILKLTNTKPNIDSAINSFLKKYQSPLTTIRTLIFNRQYQNPITNTNLSYTDFYNNYEGSYLSLLRLELIANLVGAGTDIDSMIKNIRDEYYFDLKVIRYSKDPNVKLLYIKKQAVIAQFLYNLLDKKKYQDKGIYKLINRIPVLTKVVIDQKKIAQNRLQLRKDELIQANKILSGMHSFDAEFIRYNYKYNETLNCMYDRAARKYNLGNLNISTYLSQLDSMTTKAGLNNAIGHSICQNSISDDKNDIFIQSVETNGKIMILKARNKILEKKIDVFNISTYLNNHSNQYFNPFTGRPLRWNRDTNQIYFEYNNGRKEIRISY